MDVAHTISVILTGGVRTPSAALVGPVADRSIGSMHVDQLFLGVHGMDARAGFTTPNLAEATTDRALIASAREVIVLADSSKWGVVGLADIAPLAAARTVVTDDALPPDALRALQDSVENVITVAVAE
jgi:DeoR/GlpR family transcriptional regulator of sugar metabolism